MSAPKKPQDRKPKATKEPQGFTFEHDGKTYTLPDASAYAIAVPGWVSADAILEPDNEIAQLRLGLAMLNAIDGHDDAKAALRAMTSGEMFGILGDWMTYGDGEVSVPQS